MTVKKIKQAMRELKIICATTQDCDDCPFAVGEIHAICPVGDLPFEWLLDWPEDEGDTKSSSRSMEE